jgi:hypothetical protein
VFSEAKNKFVYIVRNNYFRAMPWLSGLLAGLTLQVQVQDQARACKVCVRPNGTGGGFGVACVCHVALG